MAPKQWVCIIGAGTAGLCAVKNVLEHNMQPVVYEQTNAIGGTWVYSEQAHEADDGPESVSAIYEGLRTNLPKEVMGYPDYLYPPEIRIEESFVLAKDVLKFLKTYAEEYHLEPYVKFLHSVIRVRPRNDGWEVMVRDLEKDVLITKHFDYVLVCNGHFTTPLYPTIPDMKLYQGVQTHSRYYRKSDAFKDKKVLIVGGGSSALDIALQIHKVAQFVYLSHHLKKQPDTRFMPNVIQKPDVAHFTENGAIFKDETSEEFSCVIYCTGYKYTFPFLSVDSGIWVEDNHVQPLYKQCINIRYPTMAIIGIPYKVCPTQMCDMQLRFVLKYYSGQKALPSKGIMEADMNQEFKAHMEKGYKKREAHMLGKAQFDYFTDLSEIAEIENIKPVVKNMLLECGDCKFIYDLETFRKIRFRAVDDVKFITYRKEEYEERGYCDLKNH